VVVVVVVVVGEVGSHHGLGAREERA